MKPGEVYMHERAMDVCFEVHGFKLSKLIPGKVVVSGDWINLGYVGVPYRLGFATFILPELEVKNWINITDRIFLKRTKSGLP